MKKTILLIFTATILFNCAITKQNTFPDYVLGVKDYNKRKQFIIDSLNVVTPSIEIYNSVDNKSYQKYDDREVIKTFVIETLKSELNKNEHYELSLMSKDYLTVNRVLENITYQKYKNPDWIVKAPQEILISEKKYTLLITLTGHTGDKNNGVMYSCVINNEDKIFEIVDRYDLNGSPLNTKQLKKRIQKAIDKIIKT